MKKKNNQIYLPSRLKNFLLFFSLFIIVYTVNPFFNVDFWVRIVGVKVWIFYLLLIAIGFEFIESEFELKKLCNFFAIVAIIPCVIGILQYLGSYYIDYKETMLFFYGGNELQARIVTQNLTEFHWGGGIEFFRLPSTFTFATQFNAYTICALVPTVASVSFSKTFNEKIFYSIIVGIVILGAYSSGIRSTTLYFLLFFIFFMLIRTQFYKVLSIAVVVFIALSFTGIELFPTFMQTIFLNVSEITTYYGQNVIFSGYGNLLSSYFFGAGVGSNTFEARYVMFPGQIGFLTPGTEIFYQKVIIELGALGLVVVIMFFMIIIHEIVLSIRNLKDKQASVFCTLVLALFILMLIMASKGGHIFTKYPSNFLFYLFFGMAIKLRFLNFDNKK
jgi:hypothetical protein